MLSVACGIAESNGLKQVLIANHGGDHAIYPDCRSEFIQAMDKAMRSGTYENIGIFAPYTDISKTEIASRGKKLNLNYAETGQPYFSYFHRHNVPPVQSRYRPTTNF